MPELPEAETIARELHGRIAGRTLRRIRVHREELVEPITPTAFRRALKGRRVDTVVSAFTIYPGTKMGNERMVEIVKQYGSDRIFIDSAADWGKSDPLAVPKTAHVMLERGIQRGDVEKVTYENAIAAYSQSGQLSEADWDGAAPIDQRTLYEGSSVLRGGQEPRVDENLIE